MNKKRIQQIKCLFTLFFVVCASFYATRSYAQNNAVTIRLSGVSMERVMNEIENQTNYLFLSNKDVDINSVVSVDVEARPLSEALAQMVRGTDVVYRFDGKYILLSKADRRPVTVKGVVTDADGAPITGFDISFAEGEATAAGTVKSYTLMLPEYDTVGIYSYEIAEVVDDDARTAGVTYNGQKLLLKVTVIQTEDGRVRVAAVHLGNEDGDKVKQVVNTYAAGTLDVTKTVAGLMGEANRDFRFTVTLTRPAELVMASTIGLTVAGTAQSFTPVWDSNGRCTVTFDLRHGQTASLTNLPYGMSYTVAEDDYTAIGYTTEKTGDSGTISAAGVTAAFTNAKGGSVDTGVLLDSAPYAMLLVLALAGGAVLFLRRRAHRS